jgi:hypothetical protein
MEANKSATWSRTSLIFKPAIATYLGMPVSTKTYKQCEETEQGSKEDKSLLKSGADDRKFKARSTVPNQDSKTVLFEGKIAETSCDQLCLERPTEE